MIDILIGTGIGFVVGGCFGFLIAAIMVASKTSNKD